MQPPARRRDLCSAFHMLTLCHGMMWRGMVWCVMLCKEESHTQTWQTGEGQSWLHLWERREVEGLTDQGAR